MQQHPRPEMPGAVCQPPQTQPAHQRIGHGGSAAAMAYALVCGLGLGWLADRTGHLWPGMLLHSANNLLVLAMG